MKTFLPVHMPCRLLATVVWMLAGCASVTQSRTVGATLAPMPTPLPGRTPVPTATPPPDAIPSPDGMPLPTAAALPTTASLPPTVGPPQAGVLPQDPGAEWALLADGFDRPVHLTHAGDARLFVVEQPGLIWILTPDGRRFQPPFLDLRERVGSEANEQGLLSVAFHPQYAQNGRFFVNYTDRRGDTVVSRFTVSADPNAADPASEQVILKIDQPASNHNGGQLQFGPDGHLYIGMGDGGRAGDPWGNAQNTGVLLGKLLRLDVTSALPYVLPPDNPALGPGARPEIWAYGLRNPWRFSFDRATGDLYIGDVGQNAYEEIDFQPAGVGGQNYGWNILEGHHRFAAGSTEGFTSPAVEISQQGGHCSITGGYVYRGGALPHLYGVYLFGDYCSGVVWGMLRAPSGEWQFRQYFDTRFNISSFGEDAVGELYLVDLSGGVYRLAPGQ